MITESLRLVGEVVRIHADAVASDEARTEGQEVPLRPGGLQDGFGVDPHLVEDDGEFVHKGDVEVSLRVLDDLRRLCDANTLGPVGSRIDDVGVEGVDPLCHLWRRSGRYLDDRGQTMLPVAGVGSLRAVAAKEIDVELQTRDTL